MKTVALVILVFCLLALLNTWVFQVAINLLIKYSIAFVAGFACCWLIKPDSKASGS